MSDILCKYCGTPVDPSVAPDALCGCDGEVLAEKDAEIERLRERIAELERQIDEALAVLRLPGLDNNGGPADLAEEVRVWNGNLNRYMRDGHHITDAQIEAAWALTSQQCKEYITGGIWKPIGAENALKELGIERCPSGKGWIKT